jgi:hypothetical protein
MGLDILSGKFQTIAEAICLDEFLYFLSTITGALEQFKTMLNALIITAGESVAALNIIIAQLETANSILQTLVNAFDSAKNAAESKLQFFPFADSRWDNCPPVHAIKQAVISHIPKPDPSSILPGNAAKYAKKYKQATQAYKELKYRLYRNQKQIDQLKQKVNQLQQSIVAWQAVVDAIAAQFGV